VGSERAPQPAAEPPFEYDGPPELEQRIAAALARVVDPEMALDIVNLGLVYGVYVAPQADAAAPRHLDVMLTMTSAACPVAELIIEDVRGALQRELGGDVTVEVALVWEPPWSPERMSPRARLAMGW
jgi:metal-sulfur cluster biosynthetic enzyme